MMSARRLASVRRLAARGAAIVIAWFLVSVLICLALGIDPAVVVPASAVLGPYAILLGYVLYGGRWPLLGSHPVATFRSTQEEAGTQIGRRRLRRLGLTGVVIAWLVADAVLLAEDHSPVLARTVVQSIGLVIVLAAIRWHVGRTRAAARAAGAAVVELDPDAVAMFADRWVARIRSTEPADRAAAEAAIVRLFVATGAPPVPFVWVRSPLEAQLAIEALGRHAGSLATGPASAPRTLLEHPRPAGVDAATFTALMARLAEDISGPRRSFGEVEPEPWLAGAAATTTGARGAAESAGAWDSPDRTAELVALLAPRVVPRVADDVQAVADALEIDVGGQTIPTWPGDPGETLRLAAAQYIADQGGQPLSSVDRARSRLMESTGGWWTTSQAMILAERPIEVHRDAAGRLHALEEPAALYADGWGIFAVAGEVVPRAVIERPSEADPSPIQLAPPGRRERLVQLAGSDRYAAWVSTSAARVSAEPQREIARVALVRFGIERFVREAGRVIDTDLDRDRQVRRLWHAGRESDPPVVMVEVVNSTPEPDGTRQHHFLRVPPTMTTCGEAVAWTFGLTAGEYAPRIES